MKNIKGNLAIEIGIVLVIIGLLAAFFIPVATKIRDSNYARRYSKENYSAWVKLTNRSDFTYEEWVAARKAGLITVPVVNYSNINKERIENE